jgi:hypothetical protein
MTDNEKGAFIYGAFLGAALTVVVFGVGGVFDAGANEAERWRAWTCQQGGARLVADTLCVRADTSYRVAEPLRGPSS